MVSKSSSSGIWRRCRIGWPPLPRHLKENLQPECVKEGHPFAVYLLPQHTQLQQKVCTPPWGSPPTNSNNNYSNSNNNINSKTRRRCLDQIIFEFPHTSSHAQCRSPMYSLEAFGYSFFSMVEDIVKALQPVDNPF